MTERRFKHDPAEMWWVPQSACVGVDPELFFPVGTNAAALAQTQAAKEICRRCTVRPACLEWSLATCQDAGVWGGLDEEERREIRRARRREAARRQEIARAPASSPRLTAVG